MSRKFLIAGNWKMNLNLDESVELASEIKNNSGSLEQVDILISPNFLSLSAVANEIEGSSIHLAAQNCYHEESGAYTGEISVDMIRSTGTEWVILGHSERRTLFGETDEGVSKKLKAVMSGELKAITCVGETLLEREEGIQTDVVRRQVSAILDSVTADEIQNVVIAYEPVWAIGTGKVASPEQAEEMHAFIRSIVKDKLGDKTSESILILYGGSVSLSNAKELLEQPDIDGALIGGASLDAESFVGIAQEAEKIS